MNELISLHGIIKNLNILTTNGINWDAVGFVLLTAVTITDVSPNFTVRKRKSINYISHSFVYL